MRKILFIALVTFAGISASNASGLISTQTATVKAKEQPVEIDTILSSEESWLSDLKELAKEGWELRELLYEKDKRLLILVERPLPQKNHNKMASKEKSIFYIPEWASDNNDLDYSNVDAYYENHREILHIVGSKIVERIPK